MDVSEYLHVDRK